MSKNLGNLPNNDQHAALAGVGAPSASNPYATEQENLGVLKSGGAAYTKKRLAFIEGSNATITVSENGDDVEVTIACTNTWRPIGGTTPLIESGSGSQGASSYSARRDHVHPWAGAGVHVHTDYNRSFGSGTNYWNWDPGFSVTPKFMLTIGTSGTTSNPIDHAHTNLFVGAVWGSINNVCAPWHYDNNSRFKTNRCGAYDQTLFFWCDIFSSSNIRMRTDSAPDTNRNLGYGLFAAFS